MTDTNFVELSEPRIIEGAGRVICGLSQRYTFDTIHGIPAQWQRFVPHLGAVAGEVAGTTYGVCCNDDASGAFDYICGVELREGAETPEGLTRIRLAPQRYAVFTHRGHISGLPSTTHTVWNKGLAEAGLVVAEAPNFERYDHRFDPQTGNGEVELWIPIV